MLSQTFLFGGTLGQQNKPVQEIATSPNGKLVAMAIDGAILIYETDEFELIRIYEGDQNVKYTQLMFSSDSTSQLICMTD